MLSILYDKDGMGGTLDLELSGKVAVVTGASAGIGAGIAEVLASEGVETILVARREERITVVAERLADLGFPRPVVFPGNVTDREFAASLRDFVEEKYGHLDILVNNAGGSRPVPIDAGDDVWEESYELNFTAGRRTTQALLDLLRASDRGRIISITGVLEPHGVSAGTPAKAGVHAWSKAMSTALARDGITVNCIAPGTIESEQMDNRLFPEADARAAFVEDNVPVGRFGKPREMGYMAAFIASSRADYVTGEVIRVDGGLRKYPF
ncbi:SDR family NAD(P)-dependent oxidoreductase [Nesterenkonia suensis]